MKHNYNIDDTFLARWLNNELSEAELTEFKTSEDYHLFQKIADKSTLFKVPEFDEEKSFIKLQEKLAAQKTTKVRRLIPNWAYAVAASVAILFGVFQFVNQDTTFESTVGQQLAYVLPDGSEVKLNGASSLSFDKKDWASGIRTLELAGEGYFKVQKGSDFSVKTTEGMITVVGTQFNVQTVKGYLSVECYEGKVRVENETNKTLLTHGKGVRFTENKKIDFAVANEIPNWINHNYQYNAVPLSVVFKDVANLYNVKVVNNNIDLTQKYSGKLIKNDLEKSLLVVCKPMDIQFSIDNNTVTILH